MFTLPVFECLWALVVSINALLACLPLAGADLPVLFIVLERLHQSEYLVNISADGQIVELHVSQDSLAVDDIGGAEVECVVSGQAAVVPSELLRQICEHGDLHSAEASLIAGLVRELLMGEVGVDGGSDHLTVYNGC